MEQSNNRGTPAYPWPGRLERTGLSRRHLLLAGTAVVLIYLIGVTGKWWPTPDSAIYLGLGRSLAEGNGYYFNGSPCNIVTPGLPLILAGLRILFGDGFWAPNLFIVLTGLTTLLFVYLTLAMMVNRAVAMAVTLATGLSYTFFYQSHRVLTDAPFAALFWMLLYAWQRYRAGNGARWVVLIGLLSAVSVFIRMPGILVLVPLAVGLMVERSCVKWSKKGLAAGMVLAVIFLEVAGFYLLALKTTSRTPLYAEAAFSRISTGIWGGLSRIGRGLVQLPLTLPEMFSSQGGYVLGILVGLPTLLLVGIGCVVLWKRGQRFVLPLILLNVLILGFSGGRRAIRPRYLLPIQPLLFLVAMEGLCWCVWKYYQSKSKLISPAVYQKVITVFTVLVILSNAPKVLRNAVYYSYLSHTSRYYEVIRSGKYVELFGIAEVLRSDSHDRVVAAETRDERLILHFLSGKVTSPLRGIKQVRKINPSGGGRFIKDLMASHKNLGFIVLRLDKSRSSGKRNYREKLSKMLDSDPRWRVCYRGERHRVYQLVPSNTGKS